MMTIASLIEPPAQGHVMHLHVALGVGTLQLYTVGNAQDGWQYVAAGEPFSVSVRKSLVSVVLGSRSGAGSVGLIVSLLPTDSPPTPPPTPTLMLFLSPCRHYTNPTPKEAFARLCHAFELRNQTV